MKQIVCHPDSAEWVYAAVWNLDDTIVRVDADCPREHVYVLNADDIVHEEIPDVGYSLQAS